MLFLSIVFGLAGIILAFIGGISIGAANVIQSSYYLMLFGGIALIIFAVFLFFKSNVGEDVAFTIREIMYKTRFKKFVKKYQSEDFKKYPNRYDVKRIREYPNASTVYKAILCEEFNIAYPSRYYRLLIKGDKLVKCDDAFERILKEPNLYGNLLDYLVKQADSGFNYARVLVAHIYYYGVIKDGKEVIKPNKKLAMQYINLAIKDGSKYAIETLIKFYNQDKDYKKADDLLEKHGLKNTFIHYKTWSYAYLYGVGTEVNYEKALKYYKKCELRESKLQGMYNCYMALGDIYHATQIVKDLKRIGHIEGTLLYAHLLNHDLGKQKKAFRMYRRLYKNRVEDSRVSFNIGYCYDAGIGVKQNYDKAIKFYKIAAQKGSIGALDNIGIIYSKTKQKNSSYLLELYKQNAEKGSRRALCQIGRFYESGIGVKQDLAKAFEYYKKAADEGLDHGYYSVARCYYYGKGVVQNTAKAIEWAQKAKDYELSQYLIGLAYYEKEKNYKEAIKYLENCVRLLETKNVISIYVDQYREARFMLGYSYGKTKKDIEQIESYEKAVKYGSVNAAHNLGVIYREGLGVTKDIEKANQWFKKAKELEKSQKEAA